MGKISAAALSDLADRLAVRATDDGLGVLMVELWFHSFAVSLDFKFGKEHTSGTPCHSFGTTGETPVPLSLASRSRARTPVPLFLRVDHRRGTPATLCVLYSITRPTPV